MITRLLVFAAYPSKVKWILKAMVFRKTMLTALYALSIEGPVIVPNEE